MIDLVAGQIDIMFDQASNSLPQCKTARSRRVAVTSPTRLASAPDIPTVDEAGLPGLYISYWHGIWAPKNTPKEIVTKLNAAIVAVLADPVRQAAFRRIWGRRFRRPTADARGARRLPEGRDREMVADREGRGHQARVVHA